jgi:hypothetical protein
MATRSRGNPPSPAASQVRTNSPANVSNVNRRLLNAVNSDVICSRLGRDIDGKSGITSGSSTELEANRKICNGVYPVRVNIFTHTSCDDCTNTDTHDALL